jgi:hypothetical protein
MAQGLLARVVKEANTPAAEPSVFNAKLKAAEEHLYGIELVAASRFRQAKLMQERRLKSKYGDAYPPISLDALRTFRTPAGWPAIAIFNLDNPRFAISLKPNSFQEGSIKFTPKLPPALTVCFNDVVDKLHTYIRRDFLGEIVNQTPIVLAAEYTGLIPLEIKEKIEKAQKVFRQIFILAEPIGWSLTKSAILPADPIVVGWDGKDLYFIAEYDTTPVEDALLCEGPANKGK